ncbi:MAG: T9SS type A sorting domain-containing protein, partial [Ignavibacteria bacterium]|nr:T9SS type A sorting domain-containing protein [Ignavibacteria bacterium]
YPNPFNPSTTISFSLPGSQLVKITVYNTLGQKVSEIGNQTFSAGLNQVNFNAQGLSTGVYFISLETNSTRLSQKIILMK